MKKYILFLFIFSMTYLNSQNDTNSIKIEVPSIKFGEKQDYQVINFEALGNDQYSILYFQDLPATIQGNLEYSELKNVGAYEDEKLKKFIPYSNRVLFLVRQVFSKTGTISTDFWVLALRKLNGDMVYKMHYPENFIHPIISNQIEVKFSLNNLDLIKGLTEKEIEALTYLGKRNYNFYTYREPTNLYKQKEPSLKEKLEMLKSSMKELSAIMGKGNIPKDEKILFKRNVKDKIRMLGSGINIGKDSVAVAMYIAKDDNVDYEKLGSKKYKGDINPSFSTDIIYNENIEPVGAYGFLLNKYKDSLGENKNDIILAGIDNQGESKFWSINAGKNKLGSFYPRLSFIKNDEIYVYSDNNEKVFKPYSQVHKLNRDGSTVTLFPETESEIGIEKHERISTFQQDKFRSGLTGISGTRSQLPFGIKYVKSTTYYLYNEQYDSKSTDGSSFTTTFGNINIIRFDDKLKVKEISSIEDNQSSNPIEPRFISQSDNAIFYLLEYPKKLKLILREDGIRVENLDTKISMIVRLMNDEYVSRNAFGSLILHKTIIGNGYTLDVYPASK